MEDMITNNIDRESLKPGDHVYAYRLLRTYSHHGIYIGEDRVIHYNGTQDAIKWKRTRPCRVCGLDKNQAKGVVKSCVDCFLHGHSLRRFQYRVAFWRYLQSWTGTCTTGVAHPPEVVISRANDCLLGTNEGFGEYNLCKNNCEMFAVFCKTGKRVSIQVFTARQTFKAGVKIVRDRLLHGVKAHYGQTGVKIGRDRLLHDVKAHYGQEKHDRLMQMTESWLTNFANIGELIADLRRGGRDHWSWLRSPMHE